MKAVKPSTMKPLKSSDPRKKHVVALIKRYVDDCRKATNVKISNDGLTIQADCWGSPHPAGGFSWCGRYKIELLSENYFLDIGIEAVKRIDMNTTDTKVISNFERAAMVANLTQAFASFLLSQAGSCEPEKIKAMVDNMQRHYELMDDDELNKAWDAHRLV
jgi:hypothetical protein